MTISAIEKKIEKAKGQMKKLEDAYQTAVVKLVIKSGITKIDATEEEILSALKEAKENILKKKA